MKKLLIATTLLLLVCASCSKQHAITAEKLTDFYKTYITYKLYRDAESDLGYKLATEHMTDQVRAKMDRVASGIDVGAILNTVELTEAMAETINVTHKEGDWYLISYYMVKDKPSTLKQIALKAKTKGGELLITYLPHYACFPSYGDDLLSYPKNDNISDISNDSPLEFLESFYDVYLSGYCSMSPDLDNTLKELRSKFLSPQALNQFNRVEMFYSQDNINGYDQLIRGLDFDAMWYNSVKVTPIGGRIYQMLYTIKGVDSKIVLNVGKVGENYVIESITDNVW